MADNEIEILDTIPTINGPKGKDPKTGRFLKGGPGGPGNPYAIATAAHRRAMMESITLDDTRAVIKALLDKAKDGEGWAVKEVLDRLLGKAVQVVDAEIRGQTELAITNTLLMDDSIDRVALIQSIIAARQKPADDQPKV